MKHIACETTHSLNEFILLDSFNSTQLFELWVLEGKFAGFDWNVLMEFHRMFEAGELTIFVSNSSGYTVVAETMEGKLYIGEHCEVLLSIMSF